MALSRHDRFNMPNVGDDFENDGTDALAISRENSKKLVRILQLLEGEEYSPGLLKRTLTLEDAVFGQGGKQGLIGRVEIIWRAHVWILCTLSAVLGFILREVVRLAWHL